jgi:hypothetical protein
MHVNFLHCPRAAEPNDKGTFNGAFIICTGRRCRSDFLEVRIFDALTNRLVDEVKHQQ